MTDLDFSLYATVPFLPPSAQGHLFPLRKFRLGNPESHLPQKGLNWRSARFSREVLEQYVRDGHSLGWAIPKQTVVFDVASDGYETLRWFEFLVPELQRVPYVSLPNSGRHVYLKNLLLDFEVQTDHREFPGVRFLGEGHYVPAAGSRDWQSGGRYELHRV